MIILKIYFSFMSLLINCKDTSKNDILIIGRAYEEKDGAVVISNKDKNQYYLDGIDSWDDSIYGKVIKVSGRLLIQDIKAIPRKPGLPFPQQAPGIRRTIIKPKWELVKYPR
jgi:hypothetical protein